MINYDTQEKVTVEEVNILNSMIFGSGRYNHNAPNTPHFDLIPLISIPAGALALFLTMQSTSNRY